MSFVRKALLLTLLVSSLAAPAFAQEQSANAESMIRRGLSLLDEGNRLEASGDAAAVSRFREAAAILDSARQEHKLHNAELNHALGNAYLKSDELGHAILAYRRSLLLDPTNTQVAQTLDRARSMLQSQTPTSRKSRVMQLLLAWRGFLPRSFAWSIATGLFVVGCLLVAVRIWRPTQLVIPASALLLTGALVLFAAIALDAWESKSQRAGVVLDRSVIARTGPSQRIFDPAFQSELPMGTEFVLVDARDDWLQIQLASNAICWVPQDSVGFIHPSN